MKSFNASSQKGKAKQKLGLSFSQRFYLFFIKGDNALMKKLCCFCKFKKAEKEVKEMKHFEEIVREKFDIKSLILDLGRLMNN